jgi:hypothetical protein
VEAYTPTSPDLRKTWLDYFKRQGIEQIGFGLICVRRRTRSSHWFSAMQAPPSADRARGEDVARAIAARDFLQEHGDDDDLLAARVRVSPSLRIEPRMEPSPKGWLAKSAQLSLDRGFAYTARIDRALMEVLLRCDGRRSLRELVADAATRSGKSAEDLARPLVEVIRKLIGFGFVWPVAPTRAAIDSAWENAAQLENPSDEADAAA